jgi:hypothetical protein
LNTPVAPLKVNSTPEKNGVLFSSTALTVNLSMVLIVAPERVIALLADWVAKAMALLSNEGADANSSSEHEVIRPSANTERNKIFFI